MAQKKQDQEAQEHGVRGIKWSEKRKQLGDAVSTAKLDAKEVAMSSGDVAKVNHHLDKAVVHYAFAMTGKGGDPVEHIRAGFDHVQQARAIIGANQVL